LAELGRCDEAATLVRRMLVNLTGGGRPDLVEKLKAELKRYEGRQPCRPPADMTFSGNPYRAESISNSP
jgi:hypothetical protein